MDVEVIAPPVGVSEACAEADQGTQELNSDEEPAAAPPSPPKPKAKPRACEPGSRAPRARSRAKRAPPTPAEQPEPEPEPKQIADLRERSSQPEPPTPKPKARVRKAAPKKTRPPSIDPPARWAAPPQVGPSQFDLMPRIDAALQDYIRQQEWAEKRRREDVVQIFVYSRSKWRRRSKQRKIPKLARPTTGPCGPS